MQGQRQRRAKGNKSYKKSNKTGDLRELINSMYIQGGMVHLGLQSGFENSYYRF